MKATAPVSARLPPDLVKAERTSEAVRLRLSVCASTIKAGGLLDGALDIVLRHILGAGRQDRRPQARVHRRIGRAELGRDCDLAGELAEHLRADRIHPALPVHDVL